MGTNFYIQRTKPREVYDEYHIAKTSGGWLPSFEAYTPCGEWDERPAVHSVSDIKTLVESGDYVIIDEYDTEYDWDGFTERVLEFGDDFHNRSHHPDFKDPQGYEFLCCEYS